MDRSEARLLARALRTEFWSTASNELLARLADRGGLNVGLNPPDETDDDDLEQVLWRALQSAGLATGE
jgi:hypothetical protein